MLETLKQIQIKCYNELKTSGVKFKNGIPKINPNRMVKGNSKLDKSILMFDTLAGKNGTCKTDCYKCYAMKAQNQYSQTNLFRSINTELAKREPEILKALIIKQIKKSKGITTIRIHSSGEFFSQEYINLWCDIIKMFPDLKFYTYTKRMNDFDFSEIKAQANFNLINSMVTLKSGDVVLNYGNDAQIEKLVEEGYRVCPATKNAWKGVCGSDCNLCMITDKVCFHIH